jgi:predicted TIM-barrel fold metal-dependent hydrolase
MSQMIRACLPPRNVSRPKVPPPHACDAHAHVFGPADRFGYADDRSCSFGRATQQRILVTNPAKLYGFPN